MGLVVAAFDGKGGGDLVGLADPLLVVPSSTTPRVHEMHIVLGQTLCGAIGIELGWHDLEDVFDECVDLVCQKDQPTSEKPRRSGRKADQFGRP